MMLRTPVCSYPIIVTHLSFNFLCLLLLYSIYLNGIDTHAKQTGMEGGKGPSERRLERQQFTRCMGQKYNHEGMYLQSIKSVENLPQTPFTGQFKRKADIKGFVSL